MQRKVNVITRLLTKTEADEFIRHVLSHVANALHVLTPTKEESSKYKACNKKSVAVGMQRKVNVLTRLPTIEAKSTKMAVYEFLLYVSNHVVCVIKEMEQGMK